MSNNIVVTFNEAIQRGTGTIYLRSGSATGTIVESFDAASSQRLSISGSALTIDPTNNLANNTTYFVTFASGNIKDLAGNSYAGKTDYDFKTIAAINTINGTSNADTLAGTAAADAINGLDGNDIITGAAGNDLMNGGNGSDIYMISSSADHAVAEISDSGNGLNDLDELRFSSTTANQTLTLFAGDTGIEYVCIGTGTAYSPVTTGSTALSVNASAVLNGLTILGNNGINTITGTGFNDTLWGYLGNDVLTGGAGNDLIYGGNGNDSLTGGAGNDGFVFDVMGNTSSNKDTITDFAKTQDILWFSKSVYTAFSALNANTNILSGQFWSGAGVTTAHDTDDRIIYNTTTGILYYDADGTGSSAAVQVALVGASTHPALAYTDFYVY